MRSRMQWHTRTPRAAVLSTPHPLRLPPLTLPSAESYSFDGTRNRNLSGGGSSSATGTHNEVQNDGTYTYLYDNEGNQIRRTVIATGAVTEYKWDYRNRLIEVTDRTCAVGAATSVVTFQYDAFDRRTGKQVDSNADGTIDREEAWAWEGDQVALQLVDADGAGSGTWKLTNRYLYGDMADMILADEQLPSGGIGLTTVSATSGNVLWPLADHLGSVRDLVDSNGIIREHVVYDSFGNRLSESDFDSAGNAIASSNSAAIDHLFGYTGREWDRDVDLQYNRARWFDPVHGRWLSQDPIGFAAGDANLYRYVGNGVTGALDPSGLAWTWVTWGWEVGKASIAGVNQGKLNIVNGLQDTVVGLGNIAIGIPNVTASGIYRLRGTPKSQQMLIPYIPSPDWSKDLIVHESDACHGASKITGAAGVEILTGTWVAKAAKARAAAVLAAEGAGAATGGSAAATTLGEIAPTLADDAIVNFGSRARSVVSPPGGRSYWFRFGDIKHLSPKQVQTVIGDLASAGQPGGANVLRVAGANTCEKVKSVAGFFEYVSRLPVEVTQNIVLP